MILTYRCRLLPSKAQHRCLETILESQRQLYNAALQERIEAYRKAGICRGYVDQSKALTEWRQSDPEAAALSVRLQRATLKRLDDAHRAFYRRLQAGKKPGFPRFRGRGWFKSFGFRDSKGFDFRRGRLRFKGMKGSLRVHVHRPIADGKIKACHIERDTKGWTVGFVIDVTPEVASVQSREGQRAGTAVGVDFGVSTFATLSDGGLIPSPRAARRAERAIRCAQRALARKVRGSKRRLKAKAALARRCAAVTRARTEALHQASARLVRDYETIVVENLNVAALARGMLAKDIHDAAWGRFISMLRYKAEKAGCAVIEVDPRNTTQECCRCGAIVPKTIGERIHECRVCGLVMDRDLNAARNILNRAGVGPDLRNVAEEGMRAGGNIGCGFEIL